MLHFLSHPYKITTDNKIPWLLLNILISLTMHKFQLFPDLEKEISLPCFFPLTVGALNKTILCVSRTLRSGHWYESYYFFPEQFQQMPINVLVCNVL